MDTFLFFYTTMMGFINCRLYAMLGLAYPPKMDDKALEVDLGLTVLVPEATRGLFRTLSLCL